MANIPLGPLIPPSADFSTISVSEINKPRGIYSPFPNGASDIITLTNNTIVPLLFNTIISTDDFTMNNTSFKCNADGFYLFTISSLFFADQITSNLVIRDINTGVPLGTNQSYNSYSNNFSGIVKLVKNQEFQIDVYQNSGTSKNIIGPISNGPQLNFFSVKI